MKVNIKLVTTDENGEVSETKVFAVMENQGQQHFRIVYVQDLSCDKKITRTTLLINPQSMRVVRRGEVVSDFIYEEGVVHNSLYSTAYGNIAVTLRTVKYNFEQAENGAITVEALYFLDMDGSEASAPVKLSISVEKE